MRASSSLIMATVEDQENEHRREKIRAQGRRHTHQAATGRHFRRRSSNGGGYQATGTARQMNLLLFQDDQLRLDMAAVVVDLAWSWTDACAAECAPTGSIVPRAARYNARTMRPSLLSRFLHNSVAGLPAPSRSSLLSVVVLGLNTSAAKAKDVKLESIQTEVFNQKQAQPTWTALDCCTLTRNSIPHLARAPL